jgi:hypothetical protein
MQELLRSHYVLDVSNRILLLHLDHDITTETLALYFLASGEDLLLPILYNRLDRLDPMPSLDHKCCQRQSSYRHCFSATNVYSFETVYVNILSYAMTLTILVLFFLAIVKRK